MPNLPRTPVTANLTMNELLSSPETERFQTDPTMQDALTDWPDPQAPMPQSLPIQVAMPHNVPTLNQQSNNLVTAEHVASSTKSFKPVPFKAFAEDPATWFIVLDTQFATAHVTNEHEKWSHAVVGIAHHEETASKCRDLFARPDPTTPYTSLKSAVIHRLEKSENARLEAIILACDRGDLKPSEYLRSLKQKAPSNLPNDSLIRRALLKSLPWYLQTIFETWSVKQSLEEIAEAADNVLEKQPNVINAVTQPIQPQAIPAYPVQAQKSQLRPEVPTQTVNDLQSAITNIQQQIEALKFENHRNNWRGNKFKRKTFNHDKKGICIFHQKYKEQARNCITPCNFKATKESNQSN